jgi:hypothetical protein
VTLDEWYVSLTGEALPLAMSGCLQAGESFFRTRAHPDLTPYGLASPRFVDDAAPYAAMGLCAASAQTTHFVLTRVDARRRHYFRLPYSYGYGVLDRARADIHAFLAGYAAWERATGEALAASNVVYSTGWIDVELRRLGAPSMRLRAIPQAPGSPTPPPAELWRHLTSP